jgi:hypothetical protein
MLSDFFDTMGTVIGVGAEVHGMMYGTAAAFVIYFAMPAIRAVLSA